MSAPRLEARLICWVGACATPTTPAGPVGTAASAGTAATIRPEPTRVAVEAAIVRVRFLCVVCMPPRCREVVLARAQRNVKNALMPCHPGSHPTRPASTA